MHSYELPLVIVPDLEEADTAEVLVDGLVAGRPNRFLLDTGAARTSLVHDELTSTFAASGRVESSGVFAVGIDESITIPSLQLGPIHLEDFVAVRAAPGSPQERGLIGMDILRDYCCSFLFGEARVHLARGSTPVEGRFEGLTLDARSHPYVKVGVGPATAAAVWDTGASMTVVNESFVERNREHFAPAGTSRGTDSSGVTVETPVFTMSQAVLGGRTFAPHKVAAVDLSRVNATIEIPMDMILGYTTLRQADWLMDFPGRRWRLLQHRGASGMPIRRPRNGHFRIAPQSASLRAAMAKAAPAGQLVARCECGFEARGTLSEVFPVIKKHGLEAHNMRVTRAGVAAMAKPA